MACTMSYDVIDEINRKWFMVPQIHVERKYRVDFKLHGSGVDEAPIGLLSIDQETGIVMVNRKIDYEQYKQLKVGKKCFEISLHIRI